MHPKTLTAVACVAAALMLSLSGQALAGSDKTKGGTGQITQFKPAPPVQKPATKRVCRQVTRHINQTRPSRTFTTSVGGVVHGTHCCSSFFGTNWQQHVTTTIGGGSTTTLLITRECQVVSAENTANQ
jgi:hypothetical protein